MLKKADTTQMMRQGSLPLETAAWLATALTLASTVLGAVALHGYGLYISNARVQEVQIRTLAEIYAVQAAAAAQSGRAEAIEAWLRDLASHPSVMLVGVLDIVNEPVAVRGSESLLQLFMPGIESVRDISAPITAARPSPEASPVPSLMMASIPIVPGDVEIPIGRLICIARTARTEVSLGQIGQFFILLGLIATTGLVLAVAWFRSAFLRPLMKLVGNNRKAAEAMSCERGDEIGQVARIIADLRQRLDQSHLRASHLQRTLRDRVAEETHDITRELRRLERRTWIDPLTRLGNRQLFEDRFDEVFRSRQESGAEMSVIMLDVDNFKVLNDTLGHNAGDEVLKFVGDLLRQFTREEDLAIRMGGDEFLIVLPSVSAENACSIAQRTILLFAQNARLLEVDPTPTISGGVASLHRHNPATAAELLQMADAALYESKRGGKSRVSIHEDARNLTAVR